MRGRDRNKSLHHASANCRPGRLQKLTSEHLPRSDHDQLAKVMRNGRPVAWRSRFLCCIHYEARFVPSGWMTPVTLGSNQSCELTTEVPLQISKRLK